jgi:hypothetical protein
METHLSKVYGGIENEYGGIENECGGIENEYGGIEKEYGGIEKEYGGIEKEYGGIEKEYGGIEKEYDGGKIIKTSQIINNYTLKVQPDLAIPLLGGVSVQLSRHWPLHNHLF